MKTILNKRRRKTILFSCFHCGTEFTSDEYKVKVHRESLQEVGMDICSISYKAKEVCPTCATSLEKILETDEVWEDGERVGTCKDCRWFLVDEECHPCNECFPEEGFPYWTSPPPSVRGPSKIWKRYDKKEIKL